MRKHAFTLIELLVVISIIALLIGILLPVLGATRTTARQMKNSTQVRGIHQGMVIFAQSNKGWYPGVVGSQARSGTDDAFVNAADINTFIQGENASGSHVGARFAIMLEDNLFSAEYAISPAEEDGLFPASISFSQWTPTVTNYNFNRLFYSYALPQIAEQPGPLPGAGRYQEWSETLNSQSVAITDRLVNIDNGTFNQADTGTYRSLWSKDGEGGDWGGSVTYNDGHTAYSVSPVVEQTRLDQVENPLDNVFRAEGNAETGSTSSGAGATMNTKMIFRGFINSI